MSGPPCQPIDVSKSKRVYSHKSQHTAKKNLIVHLFSQVGIRNTLG